MIERKKLTFLGCAMIHFVTGTIYCTGNIMPYIASYIGFESGFISISSMSIVFYICILSYAISFQPSAWIQGRFSPKKCIYIGAFTYPLMVFITSALKDRISIIIVYGVLLGISSGFPYAPSLMIAISCYPNRKGVVTGVIIGCFAFGSFFFNFIATAIVNPSNKKALYPVTINGKVENFFEKDIADNVPKMFLILASIYSAILLIAVFLIKDQEKPQKAAEPKHIPNVLTDHNEDDNHLQVKKDIHEETSREHSEASSRLHSEMEEEKHEDNSVQVNKAKDENIPKNEGANPDIHLTVLQVFKTRQFYQIFFGTMFSGTAGMFAIASFKTIGLEYGYEDSFLTIVGSVGSIMNGSNRPFWGYLFDKRSYRFAYMTILLIQIALCFTFPAINKFQVAFLIWIILLYSCSGGHFTQLAPIAVRVYGKETGLRVYAYFILGMGLASLSVYFIQTYVVLFVDKNTFFYILGGLSICSLISNCLFREKITVKT